MELTDLRKEIDTIDSEIVRLFKERLKISRAVAEYKIENGRKVFDKAREDEKIRTLTSYGEDKFEKRALEEFFRQIMAVSRKIQYRIMTERGNIARTAFIPVDELYDGDVRVVFQGAEGAYSQAAMNKYFKGNIKSGHVDTFRDAMVAIEEGSADFAILPIENSTAGIVGDIFDLLVEFENYIVGEQIIKIEHCLLGVKGSSLNDVKRVYSHPQSLMQSQKFISDMGYEQISMQNNAFAARKVSQDNDKSKAAIASEYAAEIYGLDILKKGVNMNKDNSTRFIVVTNRKIFMKNAGKISICFELPHESGSLYRILSHFIYNDLNMTKIESRPIAERSFEYRFFVDFEGNLEDSAVKNALRGLRDEAKNLKVLGNY